MPVLHLENVPADLYERLQQLAQAANSTAESQAISLLKKGLLEGEPASQAKLLAELRRRSFTPPPGMPDSVELLREDRNR